MIIDRENLKKVMFIVNPVSGKRTIQRNILPITEKYLAGGYETAVYPTFARGDATEYTRALSDRFDMVVCAGGDGTLNETITGLIESGKDVVLGYIPCGSTNDFSNCHGLAMDNVKAAEDTIKGVEHKIDIGRFESDGAVKYFTYVAAFGAFSWISYSTPQNLKNVLGHTAYVFDALKEITQIKRVHLRIIADGEVFEDDYVFGAICNSTSVAGMLSLPRERVDCNDGKFELLLVKYPENLQELQTAAMCILNHNYDTEAVKLLSASEFTVEMDGELGWALDGEYARANKSISVTNLTGRMRLKF